LNKKDLAKELKEARVNRGLSIRALADEIGISAMTLSRVEREITEPDQLTRNNIEKWLKTGQDQNPPARRSYNHRIGDAEKRLSKLEAKVFKGKKKP